MTDVNDEFAVPEVIGEEDPKLNSRWVDAAARQALRLGDVPALYKTAHERLACDLALGMEDPEVIFARYELGPVEAKTLQELPAFKALVARVTAEVKESGLSFRTKMKAIAEDLIPYAHEIATDPLQSGAVRARIIEWAGKMAGFEPAPAKTEVGAGAGGFSLSITFAGQQPQQVLAEGRTLEHTP